MKDTRKAEDADRCGKNVSARKRRCNPLKWTAIALAVIVGVPMLLLTVLSLWLTPERLTRLVNEEAGKYLNADIKASSVDYTLWRTFPRLRITTGDITVRSRTLDSISPDIRRLLPDSADFLGALKSFSGEINVVDLFMNRYVIHDIRVDGLRINLVAYNDSINNYNILPSSGEKMKRVPYISINRMALKNPGTISYYSASTDTRAGLNLADLTLTRLRGHGVPSDSYRLELGGKITAASAGLRILHNFPFSLGGKVRLRFNPFGVQLSDYDIDLGQIHSKLSMSVGIGDDPQIESFDYRISNVSVAGLLGYIPKEFVPSMQGLSADLQASASARLLSAWSFSSETFPSMAVDFKVAAGTIRYTMSVPAPGRKGDTQMSLSLRHSPIECDFIFNGDRPELSYIRIPEFDISTSGLDLSLGLLVTRLTGRPRVEVDLDLESDVDRTLQSIRMPGDLTASGHVAVKSKIRFSIDDFSRDGLAKGLDSLATIASVSGTGLKINSTSMGIKADVDGLNATLKEYADCITFSDIRSPKVAVDATIDKGNFAMAGHKASISGMKISTTSGYRGSLTKERLGSGIPVSIDGSIGEASYSMEEGDLRISADSITFTERIDRRISDPLADLLSDGTRVRVSRAEIASGHDLFIVSDADLSADVALRGDSAGSFLAQKEIPIRSDVNLSTLPHTPEILDFGISDALRGFMDRYSVNALLKIGRVDIRTPGFRHDDCLSEIDIRIADDSVRIANVNAMLENTGARLRADAAGLRPFILNPPSADNPLKLDLDLELDRVNINALARAYVESKGGMKNIPRHDTVTADDSIALMVPKNLRVGLGLSAREIIYTNLHLYDLYADIGVKNGIADIPHLGVATDFGKASLDVEYRGADIDSLGLDLGISLQDIDIVRFFRKFPSILRMMPEMKNLSGILSADARMGGDIFPDMYVNVPSAWADATIRGRSLCVHQSEFIRKITEMMLIRTDDDIRINDMDVHAAAHDNLLQLDPFYFEFDRYRLRMEGINNFDGDMYYHIAVEESPVPFPFSINIEGLFRHPELHFGGPHYDTLHAERISSQIQEENKVNMTKVLMQLLRAFIGTAAEDKYRLE